MAPNNETPVLAIAQRRSFEKNDAFFSRHIPLVREVARKGARLVAINGKTDHVDGDVFSRSYVFDEFKSTLTPTDQEVSIDAAFDLTGGVARYVPDVAALNPQGIRDIVVSKHEQFEVLKDLGEHIPLTMHVQAEAQAVVKALDAFASSKIIVKTDNDAAKKNPMLIGTKDYIAMRLDDFLAKLNPEKDTIVIQEYMEEVHSDFMPGIQFADAVEKEIADARKDLNRELRVHLIDARPILVTGRAGLNPTERSPLDKWVHLNQESVPGSVTELAARVARRIMDQAQALDAYLAVDLTPDGSKVVEVNGRNIGTMSSDEARPASRYAHEKTTSEIADKLVAMAERKRKEVAS